MITKNKKNICFIVDSIFDLGGIQRIVTNLCNYIINDYNINILCLKDVSKVEQIEYGLDSRISVSKYKNSFFEKIFVHFPYVIINSFLNKKNEKRNNTIGDFINNWILLIKRIKVKSFLKKNKFDYVICTGLNNCVLCSKISKKVNSTFIGWWHSSYDRYISCKEFSIKMIKKSLINLDVCVVLTNDDKKKIYNNFGINTIVIYNAVKVQHEFSKLNNKIFLAVGRLDDIKGFDELIYIFSFFCKKNSDWILNIVGDGPLKNHLFSLIREYKLENRVNLIGKTSDVINYYLNSSCLLITSKFEGFPMTLVEAISCKLPVICFDLPVFDEILGDDYPYIIKDRDALLYANCMQKIASNYKERVKISSLMYDKMINELDINNIYKKWENLLK